MPRSTRAALAATCALSCLSAPHVAAAQDGEPPVIVVTAPGGGFEMEEAAAVSRDDIYLTGSPDALASLTRKVAGVSLGDAQGNPWQPNLSWRGFTASPLQGQAQGLAAYLDGGRFNLPFGDTVPFDVIPDAALAGMALTDASPVYGLNALGGAVVMTTATGFSTPGTVATVSYGRFDEREASAATGGSHGDFGWFGAVQYRAEDGWRDHSPSELVNGFLDIGHEGDRFAIHLKLVGADTDLTGNGVAPVELLAARRRSVYTYPDRSQTRYGRASLHPWLALSDASHLEGTLYYQTLRIRSVNGDSADIEACDDEEQAGLLCLEPLDEDANEILLTDDAGQPVADVLDGEDYGLLNRGAVHTRSGGALIQFVDERALLGGINRFVLGASIDASRTRFATSAELGALTEDRSVDGLGTLIVQADGSIAPVGLIAKTRFTGLFLSDVLPVTDRLTLELGLRWNHAKITLDDRIGTALDGSHSFRRLNPGVEARYTLSDAMTLRAGYVETNRTPTPAELSCADENAPCSLANFFIADPPLKQVVARTFKLGADGSADAGGWTVNWRAGGWRTTNSDDIQHIASAIRGRAYFRNVGKTRRQGIDLLLDASRGAWHVAAGYAFLDATFRTPLVLSSAANPLAEDDGTILVMPGDRLSALPRHSGNVSVDYERGGWSLGGDVIARSSQQLVGDESGLNPRVPGYAIVNLRGTVDLIPGVSLFGELRNATDRKYASFGTFSEVEEVYLEEAPDASDPRAYGPGAPRRWTVGVRARF